MQLQTICCFSALVGLEAFWSSLNLMSKRSQNCLLVLGGGFTIPAFLVVLEACRTALRYGFLDIAVVASVVVVEVDGWVVSGGAGFGCYFSLVDLVVLFCHPE